MTICLKASPVATAAKIIREAIIIRDRWPDNEPLFGDDAKFVGALIKARCKFDEGKTKGREVNHFEVRTYKYQTRAFFAVFTGGTFVDFSYRTAARNMIGRI